MNWSKGDRAIMVNCRIMEHEGCECVITGPMTTGCDDDIDFQGWPVQCVTGNWCAKPSQLKPIPYDGNNASTWDECDFKPAIPVEVES